MNRKASALGALSLALGAAIAGCAKDAPITGSSANDLPRPVFAKSRVVAVPDTSSESAVSTDSLPGVDSTFVGITAPEQRKVMNRLTALWQDQTVSAVIGHDGGALQLPDAGVWLYIPKGAVKNNTTFSVTAVAGSMVAYEFEPHGMTFESPLYIVQMITNTGAETSDPNLYNFEGGHFGSRADLDTTAAVGIVNETLPTYVDPKGRWIAFPVTHFSGYLLASGRQ
jgi:hypothetical protein